jgi:transposase
MALALHVRLANGVELEMGKAIATIDELTTLVQILGRMPCSGSTKTCRCTCTAILSISATG